MNDYPMPPKIEETVKKLNLDAYRITVEPPPLPSKDIWSQAKDLIGKALDSAAEDSRTYEVKAQVLFDRIKELENELKEAKNITRSFDLAWDECFGPESFPFIKSHFKSRLGL